MTALNHDRLIESVKAIPPLPDTFVQLQKLFADPGYKRRDLVRAVELDSVLTGRVLKLANSAAYGVGNIDTTQQAFSRACRYPQILFCKTFKPTVGLAGSVL